MREPLVLFISSVIWLSESPIMVLKRSMRSSESFLDRAKANSDKESLPRLTNNYKKVKVLFKAIS
ncbi:MAG: hypothetical protein BBJ60_00735 [Desulfobacterales bacterium S7086C20]|nr:MAG: hypothetical protein BBJ60_00735 [Desulfobacterales bacterium S7086C20]